MGIVMGLDSIIPQAIGAGRLVDARRSLAAGLRLAVVVGLALMALVMISPLLLLSIDIPDAVATDARIYIHLRAFGIVPFLLSIALRSYLAARSVTRPLIVAVIAGNIANAILDAALIFGIPSLGLPAMGVVGAAIATVVVQILIVVVYFGSARALDGDVPRPAPTRADGVEIVRYGGPIGGQLFAEVGIFGLATVLAAYLGTLPAAAHSIALTLASFTFAMAIGIGSATNVRVGHAVGAGDRALARRRGVIGLGLGFAAMSVFAATFLVVPGVVAALFTSDAAVVLAAVPLLQIAALFQLSDGAQAIAAGALRGLGDTRATFIGNVIGHYAVGLPISLALAFGAGMGAPGLWWGLSVGLTVTAAYLIVKFLRGTRA
jgi:MATE family multidrug resistance protein